jgi:hypothetical protein
VLVPAVLGGFFLVVKGWVIAGAVLLALALVKLGRLVGDDQLDSRLQRQEDKLRFGIGRLLTGGEKKELELLQTYADDLGRRGVEPRLGREVTEEAWQIIKDAGVRDATVQLRVFRDSLPVLGSPKRVETPLQERLRRELDMLGASEREVESAAAES